SDPDDKHGHDCGHGAVGARHRRGKPANGSSWSRCDWRSALCDSGHATDLAPGIFARSAACRSRVALARSRRPRKRIRARHGCRARRNDMIRRKLFSPIIFSSAALWCAACGANSNSTTKAAQAGAAQTTEEIEKVALKKLPLTTRLPGELQGEEAGAVFLKVTAYVDS